MLTFVYATLCTHTQMFQVYPALERFYFPFEKSFDANPVTFYMQNLHFTLPIAVVALYLMFCYRGPKIMHNCDQLQLQCVLALWNLTLCIFGCYGVLRTVPHLLHRMTTVPFEDTVCEPPCTAFGSGAAALAIQLFVLSKFPELLDTVFIVLRKKPLLFLHWYHHVTVLLYCWNSYVTESGNGLYFAAMNYTAHTAMYFYYFLQAMHWRVWWFPYWVVTAMQIVQMIIGAGVVAASFYYYYIGVERYPPGTCSNPPSSLFAGGVMYTSYLYLFVVYAWKRARKGKKE